MAALVKNLCALMVLCLINGALNIGHVAGDKHDEDQPPINLDVCLKGMNEDCSIIIVGWVVLNKLLPPSIGCCNLLLQMGRECHDGLVHVMIDSNLMHTVGGHKAAAKRSDLIWKYCKYEVEALSEAPMPPPKIEG